MPGVKSYASMRPTPTGWRNLAWKLLLAFAIFLLLSAGIAVPTALVWPLVWTILLAWGGLVVAVSTNNLFDGARPMRWASVALAVGAYAALALPGVIARHEPGRVVEAIGPVAALTLAAHLPRRDLPRALRDWALVLALALFFGLGVIAMSQVVISFGVIFFLSAVLLPPLVAEAVSLFVRRLDLFDGSALAPLLGPVAGTIIGLSVFTFGLANRAMPPVWLLIFNLIAALLMGGALLLNLLLRPMVEAASGAYEAPQDGLDPRHALVELSHGPILISLAIYLLMRLGQLA